jgi:uncharacterized membrane protein YhiD involved in acid resistance
MVRPPEAERSLEAAGQLVRNQLLEMLRRRVFVADESPTVARMFMFVEHVKSLLLWHFLKLPAKIWKSNQARFGRLVVGVVGGVVAVVGGGWCAGAGAGWRWCWFQEHTRFPHKAALLCRHDVSGWDRVGDNDSESPLQRRQTGRSIIGFLGRVLAEYQQIYGLATAAGIANGLRLFEAVDPTSTTVVTRVGPSTLSISITVVFTMLVMQMITSLVKRLCKKEESKPEGEKTEGGKAKTKGKGDTRVDASNLQESYDDGGVYVAVSCSEKYHSTSECHSLKCAKKIKKYEACNYCVLGESKED